MTDAENADYGTGMKRFEIVVGFAGSSRTHVEFIEATDRLDAIREARDKHGCTAVAQEVYEL